MSTAERTEIEALARNWIVQIWHDRDVDAIEQFHAPDFIDHSPAGRSPDLAAYKQSIIELYSAFPDWKAHVEDLITDVEQSKVAIRWSGTGTHHGTFLGCPLTERVIRFVGIDIIRVQDGKIVERWGEWDGLALVEQMST